MPDERGACHQLDLMENHQRQCPSLAKCSLTLACSTPAFGTPSGRIELADGGWHELGRCLHDLLHDVHQNVRLALKLRGYTYGYRPLLVHERYCVL